MKGECQNKKAWIRGKEVFIGVDVHKESWHVTVRAEDESWFFIHRRILSEKRGPRMYISYDGLQKPHLG